MAVDAPTAALPATTADIRTRVQVAQMGMIFEQTSVAVFAATAYAIAMVVYLQGEITDGSLMLWLWAKIAISIPRVVHGHMFRRRRNDSLNWLYWGRAMLFVDGLVWGSAILLVTSADHAVSMPLVVVTLAGVSTVAAFVLHADWPCCVAYTAPMQAPGIVTMLARADSFGYYGAFSIAAFFALLLVATRRSERHVVEMLTLRYANEELTSRLSSALDLARSENRAKNEFVANMSHELRTPLHGILGVSSMLISGSPATNPRDGLTVIRRCGEHLLGLINNILEYSRFGAQGMDLHPQQVDLSQLVEDTVEMCTPGSDEKGLTLNCDIDLPRPCMVTMDPFRLRQILLNLVGNAVKFTDRGSVSVHAEEIENGTQVRIRVADTGVGIAPSARDSIFEPFVQVDSSNTRKFGGTGLGLSITRAICNSMGGRIAYASAVGVGSTFEVVLPLLRPVEVPALAPKNTASASASAHAGTMRGTVLLAEDNDVNAIVAESSLIRLGVNVERVSTGTGVVARVCQTNRPRPDLVLLDCQMPEMDGFEAARRIRKFEVEHGLSRLPLVALTANVFPEDRAQCIEAGMDDFLAKPFNGEQLREILAARLPVVATSAH